MQSRLEVRRLLAQGVESCVQGVMFMGFAVFMFSADPQLVVQQSVDGLLIPLNHLNPTPNTRHPKP